MTEQLPKPEYFEAAVPSDYRKVIQSYGPEVVVRDQQLIDRIRARRSDKAFNPDQPRDAHGRWAKFLSSAPQQFIMARDRSTRQSFLSPLSVGDLTNHRLYLGFGGKVGYALDANNDLQNVFNNGGPKGAGRHAILDAVKNGADTLDAFEGHLTELYSQYGFTATARVPFNDEYAPPGWDYARYGRPDVVFMVYNGGDRTTIGDRVGTFAGHGIGDGQQSFSDYDGAKAAQQRARVDKQADTGRAPGVGASAHRDRRGGISEVLVRHQGRGSVLQGLLKFNPDQVRDAHGRWTAGSAEEWVAENWGPAMARVYQKYMSHISPVELRSAMVGGLNKSRVDFYPLRDHDTGQPSTHDGFEYEVELRTDDGLAVGTCTRAIDFTTGSVHHSAFVLEPQFQGQGLAKQVLTEQVGLYQELGLSSVSLHASLDVGGYAWLRFGFKPSPGATISLGSHVSSVLSNKHGLSSEAESGLRVLADRAFHGDTRALWAIADSTVPTTTLVRRFPPPQEGGNVFITRTVPFGKYAFMNQAWTGSLNLRDAESMDRFNVYVH